MGFITRGRGISVHRTDCDNVIHMSDFDKSRLIEVEWMAQVSHGEKDRTYFANLSIYASNRTGFLADVSKLFAEQGVDIDSLSTKTSKQGIASCSVVFRVGNREEIDTLTGRLKQIPGIIDIERG